MLLTGRKIAPGTRILVAMSGGVDSAVTACLLKREGFECVGINMRTHTTRPSDASQRFQSCCSPEDAADARAVAARLDMPFFVLDLEREFDREVIQPFIKDYLQGRTPNPCVLCNNHLKLGVLLDKANAWGCDYIATGHYARVEEDEASGRAWLLRGSDPRKDQSYYLFGLTQPQLRRLVCPLGAMDKPQVRELAREFGLPVHDKPDSQEICFVPQNDYRAFLRSRVGDGLLSPGNIVTRDGIVLGHHAGTPNYTIGQRRGLGIASERPLYVIDILPEQNLVVVGHDEETLCDTLTCEGLNWVCVEAPLDDLRCEVQIRYRHAAAPAVVKAAADGKVEVRFDSPQRAITPGQAAVFYSEDKLLGGGWICR